MCKTWQGRRAAAPLAATGVPEIGRVSEETFEIASANFLITYRAELVPWLWMLSLSTDCRIFQKQTAIQILDTIFGEYGATAKVEKALVDGFRVPAALLQLGLRFAAGYKEGRLNFFQGAALRGDQAHYRIGASNMLNTLRELAA